MLYYRDFESYEGQSRHKSSDQRSGSSAEGQLVVEWLRSAPQPLDGMPRGNEEGAPRFSGHPDDLIWFLEDVQELCMQASCFEDHEWARWCPAVCYSKHDLYDLVNKQKKVKINSYQALLNYWLCFTDITVQLQISSQLSWIEKDDLFLEGLLEEGYRFELREACLARDQWSAREAQYEAEMQQLRAVWTEEQCREPERCSESARLGSKASQPPSSTLLKIQSLTHSLQDSSKPSKAPGVGSRSQAVKVDSIESSFECIEVTSCIAKGSLTAGLQGECLRGRLEEKGKGKVLGVKASVEPKTTEAWGDSHVSQPKYFHSSLPPLTDIQPQIPPIELRDTEDEQRANKRPVEAEAHALEVPKPTLEPRGDLCEVPDAAAVEIYTSLSQKSENCLLKGYEVYGRKVEVPHSGGWSAILRLYGVLHRVFEAMRLGIEPKQSPGPHWHPGQDPSLTLRVSMFFLGCMKVSEESNEHKTPSRLVCLLWRVFLVFLEDALWSGELLSRPLLRSGNPALSHWTLTLVRGLMLSWLVIEHLCEPTASIYEYLGHQERAKRWQGEAPP
ncbi:hypothetical protein EDD16DRAFT_1520168 [Pisolithus croceorrhizus]|nr:hypothetical protein EDD16DRAFT_1520168 [Pisolithus croceorrhizus]KAI6167460.1 hypothetical protein EDD17DRAFT_1504571 [Pisolithus thermaeus]